MFFLFLYSFSGFIIYKPEELGLVNAQKVEIERLNREIEMLENTLSFIPNKTADYTTQISKLHSVIWSFKDLNFQVIEIIINSLRNNGIRLSYKQLGLIYNTIFGKYEYFDDHSRLLID